MTCAWQELLSILPDSIAKQVDIPGRETAQEIRLRIGRPGELILSSCPVVLKGTVEAGDLNYCINTASRYSPWAAQSTASGYLTAPGGHRIGICGETVIRDGEMTGFRKVTSLCIRIARDFPGIGRSISHLNGSVLLAGPPGSGKTTLLRDLIRQLSVSHRIGVVDQRQELFPDQFARGQRVDVLTGCGKAAGMDMLLRTMGPDYIAVDEITAGPDCRAMLQAGWCGVSLLATVHAGCKEDLYTRPLYRPLLEMGLFDHLIILDRDKHWRKEEISL